MVEHLGSVCLSLPEMAGVPALQALTWVDLVWLTLREGVWAERRSRDCPSSSPADTWVLLSFTGSWAAVVCRELNPGYFFLFFAKMENDLMTIEF